MEFVRINDFLHSRERFFINHYQIEALLENIPQIIYMKDYEGNYITGTKHARKFVEKGIDDLHGVKLDFPKMKQTNCAEDRFVVENNKVISTEREFCDINGSNHWYSIYKAPIRDFDNNVMGLVVMIKNNDESKLLNAQRETFVASLGHDLKNPTLAQIRAIDLLLKGDFGPVSTKQREIIEMISDSCKYMNAMLSSLLATYRNERGVVRLNCQNMSLEDLVMECVGEMIYYAKDKEVGISIDKSCQNSEIFADKVQIKRVIMNLLSNGIKYAYKDSTLNITLYNEKHYTCFKFENSSPYIPQEKQDSIFAQYVSYADAHRELGIGLGLYASQKIVEAHEGEIFVKSFKDNRNIFGFKIPNKLPDKDKLRTVTF